MRCLASPTPIGHADQHWIMNIQYTRRAEDDNDDWLMWTCRGIRRGTPIAHFACEGFPFRPPVSPVISPIGRCASARRMETGEDRMEEVTRWRSVGVDLLTGGGSVLPRPGGSCNSDSSERCQGPSKRSRRPHSGRNSYRRRCDLQPG